VLQAIEKLQFHPDHTARTMIHKKTRTIGLVIPKLSNEYWAQLSEVIHHELWEKGYTTLICSSDNQSDKETAYLKMYIERRVDGIIYCSSPLGPDDALNQVDLLHQSGIPLVTLDSTINGVSCVTGDHLHGAFTAAEHLIRLGHRRIAYIGGPAVSLDRELGFRKAMIMYGLSVNETLVRTVSGQSFQDGNEAMQALLDAGEPFDALFCGNDLLAFGAIKAMEEAGIRIPDDVAVVGYDDIFSARLFKPALTTVRQPIADIGKELVNLLLQAVHAEPDQRPVRKIMIPTELVVRESSGAVKTE
jgi:DNA-binding LacI/PurR family transcriptional regulator